ncbi:MAG: hypothetical protein J5505_04630 [Spirochaetaceae bacterium]|nr:hypothetical protein [Spirochaetaceae bacterium]
MNNSNIVDFYFTNSLEDLNSVKNILEANNISHEIITTNNNHPFFGFNSAIGMEKNLYKYVIRIPEIFIEKAEQLLSEAFTEEDVENKIEISSEESDEMKESEEVAGSKKVKKQEKSLRVGYFVMLLFFMHYSRYFYSLKEIKDKENKNKLKIVGICYFFITFFFLFYASTSIDGDVLSGLFFTLLFIGFLQTLINCIDFVIEKQNLQKVLIPILVIFTALIFFIGKMFLFK